MNRRYRSSNQVIGIGMCLFAVGFAVAVARGWNQVNDLLDTVFLLFLLGAGLRAVTFFLSLEDESLVFGSILRKRRVLYSEIRDATVVDFAGLSMVALHLKSGRTIKLDAMSGGSRYGRGHLEGIAAAVREASRSG